MRVSRAPAAWPFVPGRLRPKSVRAKIVSLLMVPVVSLMALWAFATVTTAQNASDLARYKEVNATLLTPVSEYVTAVQAERSAVARYVAQPDPARLDALNTRAKDTRAAASALRRGISSSSTDTAALSPDLSGRTQRLMKDAGKLSDLRERIVAQETGWGDAYTGYTDTIEHGFAVGGALTGISPAGADGQGAGIASEARVVQELSRAREMIAREDALVGAAQAEGRMTEENHRLFLGATQVQQEMFRTAVDDLHPSDEEAYRAVLGSEPFLQLRALERDIADAGPGRAVTGATATQWSEAAESVLRDLRRAGTAASTTAADKADPLAFDVLGRPGIAVVLGLVGVLLSLLISVQIGRGLVVELVGMRNSALDLAGRKLPQSLRRLHAGEAVDVEAEAPVQRHGEDEIGQIGSALNAVHRAAVKAAAERAEMLNGISVVYVRLARRSQLLLHRQLKLLDSMERRTEDPAELEDLFRLDHLTTRMRRHAESLIILSGAAPVRGWRRPVPVLDVVRAAIAEVEDFARVDVRLPEGSHVSGSAVADLTHLIAELVENAVGFSPPHTQVRVRGERVGAGLALEIEDRGLGMSPGTLAAANRKIADASEVDLLDTERLGLFVVNRLAHRHGVEVSLQRSAYGGVTAVVLIPAALLEKDVAPPEPEAATAPGDPTEELPAVTAPHGVPHPEPAAAGSGTTPRNAESGKAPARTQQPPPVQPLGSAPAEGETGPLAPLPRRVRQASLAPELRADRPGYPERPADAPGPQPAARSPERARATMTALRSGWLSGQGAAPRAAGDSGAHPAPETQNTRTTSRGEEQ